ncbi:MAG: FAD-dependent oxidoreductase [Bryobacterales bacterium]|nr:FAD-dependent oxidoreductase [Bryobacterales bacterium]
MPRIIPFDIVADMRLICILLGLLSLPLLAVVRHDVIVYGGTAGGAAAAIAAARLGADVGLVEPGGHIGGMLSGGLGRTDMDRQEHVIGGISREFFERVGRHYGQPVAWTIEPSVAERILQDWLREAEVHVYFQHPLAESNPVDKSGSAIERIRSGARRMLGEYVVTQHDLQERRRPRLRVPGSCAR